MADFWSSLPVVGAYISGRQSAANAAEQHDWAVEDASVNRSFQRETSNTAHQREVKDLRAAGLNPILSGTGGAGASTPSGSMADSNVADTPDYASAANNALNATLLKGQKEIQKAQVASLATAAELNRAQAKKTSKEASILGPRSFLMQKLENAFKFSADVVKDLKHKRDLYIPPKN